MRALAAICAVAVLSACARDASSGAQSQPSAVATTGASQTNRLVAGAGTTDVTARPAETPKLPSRLPRITSHGLATAHVVAVARPTLPPMPVFSAAPTRPAPVAVADAAASAGGPKIYSVSTNPSVVHNGQSVTWDVRTSADVVSVTAHVSAYTLPLQQRGSGKFFLSFTIPSTVPSVFHGTYNLELTARAQNGASAKRDVPMIFQ